MNTFRQMNTNTRITKARGTNKHEYTNNSSIRDYSSNPKAKICKFVPIRDKGMTLIELLVSIGIVVLLLVIGVPAYRHYSYVNDLNQAAQDVKNAILETQSYALAPEENKPQEVDITPCQITQVIVGYNCRRVCSWFSCRTVCDIPIYAPRLSCNLPIVRGKANTYSIAMGVQNLTPVSDVGYGIYLTSSSQPGQLSNQKIKELKLPNGISFIGYGVVQYSIEKNALIIYPSEGEINITLTSSKLTSNNTKIINVNRETGRVSIQ